MAVAEAEPRRRTVRGSEVLFGKLCTECGSQSRETAYLEGDVSDWEFDGDVLPAANKPNLSAMRCRRTLGGEMSE